MTFAGYIAPEYTQIPNIMLDEQMADLSGSELKVLLYVARRTLGFHRNADSISLTQIANGQTGRDRGTGLSRRAAVDAIRSLEARGFIRVIRPPNAAQSHDSSTYSLIMQFELVQKGNQPGAKNTPGLVQKVHPQKKERNKDVTISADDENAATNPQRKQRPRSEATLRPYAELNGDLTEAEHAAADIVFSFATYAPCARSGAQTAALLEHIRKHPRIDWRAEVLERISYLEGAGRPMDKMISGLLSQIDRHEKSGHLRTLPDEPARNDGYMTEEEEYQYHYRNWLENKRYRAAPTYDLKTGEPFYPSYFNPETGEFTWR